RYHWQKIRSPCAKQGRCARTPQLRRAGTLYQPLANEYAWEPDALPPFLTGLSIRFHRRHFWKLRQGGIHKYPRLCTGGVEVHGWPVPSGVVQTTGHDSDHGRCSCGPGKQAGTTIGTKAATYEISAIALYVEVFDFAGDLERIPRHAEYRHK